MANHPALTTTPIKEIIFTISYNESVPVENLKFLLERKEISDRFSFIGEGFTAKISTKLNENQKPPEAIISKDGFILRNPTENKIIQVREGSFSFHKVNGYENFESLLEEFLTYWRIFIECTGLIKFTINNISLRYLNFIELIEGEKFSELTNIKILNPFLDDLTKYLVRVQFINEEYKDIVIGLVQAPTNRDLKDGLLFDIDLNQKTVTDNDFDLLSQRLHIMRNIKNDIFFKTITEHAIKKYI